MVGAGRELKVQPSNHATTLPSLSVNYHHRDYLEPRDHYLLLKLRTISYLFLSKVGIIPSIVSKHFNSFLSLHPFVVKTCIYNQPHRPPDLRTERSQLIKIWNEVLRLSGLYINVEPVETSTAPQTKLSFWLNSGSALGLCACTRIWALAMIGLLKKPPGKSLCRFPAKLRGNSKRAHFR